MPAGANLSVTDQRRAARHPVDHHVIAEHHVRGDVPMHISNISAHGFMVDDAPDLTRGDRLMIRLPIIGLIEAYVIWTRDTRAGLQFERIIRVDDFAQLIDNLHTNPRLRRP
ncbi:PilZ domain-containing protein [Pelagerythrobacter marensis]|uniref:Pilus assembly protein PilZ n=1 Tax=Pelagerythrobacter marensis TaxID=543877 RepID=A0A0G3X8K7_9SPHN|nr:PilZ domain-containing protein [Pelagerythrobacter marensis]AKM06954.1 Pilus assembly protein PilZ [Pelagerythrobacter marensis]